jgi:ketosteroid isomerase-like protein
VTDSANVELVRRATEATVRRPEPDFAVANELYDRNHVFVGQLSTVEGTTFQGARGFREWLTNMSQAWESWESQIRQVTEIDDDRVLVVSGLRLRSRRGGVALTREVGSVVTVRDGKIVRTEAYPSVPQALEAAALREQA